MFCPSCGRELADGTKFCTVCGAKLGGAVQQQQPPPESQMPQGWNAQQGQQYQPPQQPQYYQQPYQQPYQQYAPPQQGMPPYGGALKPWYDSIIIIIVSLLCCWPVGLYFLWASKSIEKNVKIIITAVLVALIALGIVVSRISPPKSSVSITNPTSRSEEIGKTNNKKGASKSEESSTTAPDSETPPEISVKISSVELFGEYSDNEVAADEKYKNKWLEVSGKITEFGKDVLTDEPYVELSSGKNDMDLTSVKCTFRDEHASDIAKMKKGQKVTVRGQCAGMTIKISVDLHYCQLVQ